MNSTPSTSEVTPQRKRLGRPPKAAQSRQPCNEGLDEETVQSSEFSSNLETAMSSKDSENILDTDGAALAISPPLLNVSADVGNPRVPTTPIAIGECRRSSRKKIIKFDVRDLLNKHRKPHKIQIEARIDSNAPQTSKSSTSVSMGSGSTVGTSLSTSNCDLSSKQKAFMEKSAIFRRISISDQQNKLNAPQLPPPLSSVPKVSMLSAINRKSNAEVLAAMDPAKIAQARRLSRTQEIFNASLMKSKQNSSLIVAQIESNSCSSSSGLIGQKISTPSQQKKIANVSSKRKSITNSFPSPIPIVDVKSSTPEYGLQKRRGRPPKTKFTLAQNTNKITAEDKRTDGSAEDITKELDKKDTVSKPTLNSATNWKEYKANLISVANTTKSSELMGSKVQKPHQCEVKSAQSEDVILEISSTSSISEQEAQPPSEKSTSDVKESPQRNFASVCILQESPTICETANAPEFIVAAVEEITTENRQTDKPLSLEPQGYISSQSMDNTLIEDTQNTTNSNFDVELSREREIEYDSFSEVTFRESIGSRKSSGSESESGSDRSNKSYKKGDKLRVSLKRLTMPPTELTSAISLSSTSNSCTDVIIDSSGSTSSNYNNSGENNSTASEISTVATSKILPTRRSHRLPKRSASSKVECGDSKSNTKTSINKNLDIIDRHKMTEAETEKNNTLPVEINSSHSAVKTDSDFESSNKEVNNAEVTASEMIGQANLVEEIHLTKIYDQGSLAEMASEQAIEASQSQTVVENEDGRNECEKKVISASSLLYKDSPSTSNEAKKERITLPLKKQVSKFKMYEAAVHNVAANVETSTLLDILKTVKQNDLTMGTKTLQNLVELESTAASEQLQPQTLAHKEEKPEDTPAGDASDAASEQILSNSRVLPTENIIAIKSSPLQGLEEKEEKLPVWGGDDSEDINASLAQDVGKSCKDEIAFKDELALEESSAENAIQLGENFDHSKEKVSEIIPVREKSTVQTVPLEELTKVICSNENLEELQTSADACKSNIETKTVLANVSPGQADSTNISNVLEIPANSERPQSVSTEFAIENLLDESSTEELNQITDSQPASDEPPKFGSKKTPSPTHSDSSNGLTSRKPTRRYERRSQRGDISAHKTLEETFAEIAAESCKAVLDLKAKEVEIPAESKEKVTESVTESVELGNSMSSDIPNNVPVSAISAVGVESYESLFNSTEGSKLDDERVSTTNITEMITQDVSNKIPAKELTFTTDYCSISKVSAVQEDGDSNSNHSSPSRRRRKQDRKKEVNNTSTSPFNIASEPNENLQKTTEVAPIEEKSDALTNLTTEKNAKTIPEQDLHITADIDAEESKINYVETDDVPNSNTINVTEKDSQKLGAAKIVEPSLSISSEATVVDATDTGLILETAIVVDVQDVQSVMAAGTVQITELETSEIQQNKETATTTTDSTDPTTDVSHKSTKEPKDKFKSRMHKKGTNSKNKHPADTELEAKSIETSSEVEQGEATKPEGKFEQPKVSNSPENFLHNTPDNILQNVIETKPPAASKEDSAADNKISADISSVAVAQNVSDQTLEQRVDSGTPIGKPKKVNKRKSTKQLSDDKSAEVKDFLTCVEDAKIVGSKEKSNEKEDAEKTPKQRKGKVANEPIKNDTSDAPSGSKNDTSDAPSGSVACTSSVEATEKELLAKAPPKKRLLKMQMQLEETSICSSSSSELPIASTSNNDTKTVSAKKIATDTSKSKESSQKKSKKEAQLSEDLKKRSSYESPKQNSVDDDSRSATSTPVAKRFKHHKSIEKTPEDKMKTGKRKPKLDLTVGEKEKMDIPNTEAKEKEKSSLASKKSEKKKFLATEDTATNELVKKLEEKSAKKKRQKKLKEAFEAALKDALGKPETHSEMTKESVTAPETDVTTLNKEKTKYSPPAGTGTVEEYQINNQIATVEPIANKVPETAIANEPEEEEPDPLKDIEKFIEDGVNLLKRGYKIEDDSVDEVICPKTHLQKDEFKPEFTKQEEPVSIVSTTYVECLTTPNASIAGDVTPVDKSFDETSPILSQNIYYETPADTPVATPTTSPPPKSPSQDSSFDEISGVRRSHRIKQITKTPKALVGRGLVREKERFSIKDDVEMKTHYSLDDHLTDLAHVEAKNAKFLKEMEERLSNFQVIKDNEYKCERVISREARKMLCDCFLTAEEEERGELGCGEDCLNRLLMIECGPDCNVKDRCTNKRFQKVLCSPCRVFRTEKKGFGIMADIEILPGEFIMEYVGEVIDGDEFEQRRTVYSLDKNRHYYFMALRSDAIIDATIKGNISRFINHSCDPNAETQKWTVNGELRIGFFSRKSIMPGEEITFDYQYQRYGREAQRCYCESANCRGWIGEEPNSDEGEQIDEDSDGDNLADGSDEDESDDSTADAEEAHRKLEIDVNAPKSAISTEDGKLKLDDSGKDKKKKLGEDENKEGDDEARAKLKKLAGKSTDKLSRKKKKNKETKQKRLRKATPGEPTKTSRYLEDPDIEDEVKFLSRGGLRNQSDTLRFSRLVVRAKLPQTRLNLLKILRNADLPCRRLFLDYHGLRLLHGWMSEDGGDMAIRLSLLEALESLPIANKTVLTDSKVYQSVRNWCGNALPAASTTPGNTSSPSDESSKESSSSNSQQDTGSGQEVPSDLQKLAIKLTTAWNSLPEIFRIPKRERIEQMKEHEREADRQFAEASVDTSRSVISDRYQRDRFGRGPTTSRYSKPSFSKDSRNSNIPVVGSMPAGDPRRRSATDGNNTNNEGMKHLSKEQRREMFAAKVARDEAEKRMAEERREFETKCRFFGLEPKKTRPQDVPFCVDPSTGQWYSVARQPIPTPPCYAHIQVPPKPKSTDPIDYKLPAVVSTIPHQWKYAISALGQIYYYHAKQRIPQWHPPTPEQLRAAADEAHSSDSESCEEAKLTNESSEDDDILIGMDEAQLKAFVDKKVDNRRQKRYSRLVDERPISPRKEEDRIYNQMEMRKYKENKEKIRKRKEEIRRKRSEALKATVSGGVNPNDDMENPDTDAIASKSKSYNFSGEPDGAIPIQDYLLSSDEDDIMHAACDNSPLLDKIVQGDKIVDELDALTTKRALKRPLPPHRDLSLQSGPTNSSSSNSGGGSEHKRRKSDKKEKSKKSKDSDSKYRRNKEKFRCEIAGIIVQHLKPYRKESCAMGRIQSDEDFNHLARKLTHFVMVKELKYCESVGQTLVVTESVKNKSREFIKKYMAKYGGSYVKPVNDPEFKDIPFTI